MRALGVILLGAALVVDACGPAASPAASDTSSPPGASPSLVTGSPTPSASLAAPSSVPSATEARATTPTPTAAPTSVATPTRGATPPASTAPPTAPPTQPPAASVSYQGFTAVPATVQVTVGTRVTWTNRDGVTHTVTSGAGRQPDGRFNGTVGPNATFAFVFSAAGTFEYFCSIHGTMSGFRVVAR